MGRPVSLASCSLMCLVGLGVCENAVLRISSCLALIVVRGPRRLDPALPSPLPPPTPPSGLLFSVWLSLVSGSPSNEPKSKNETKKWKKNNILAWVGTMLFYIRSDNFNPVLNERHERVFGAYKNRSVFALTPSGAKHVRSHLRAGDCCCKEGSSRERWLWTNRRQQVVGGCIFIGAKKMGRDKKRRPSYNNPRKHQNPIGL